MNQIQQFPGPTDFPRRSFEIEGMTCASCVRCGSAWKRDPGSGVIGVEKGPLIPVV